MRKDDIRIRIFMLLAAVNTDKELLFSKNARRITKKYIRSVVSATSESLKKTLEKNNLLYKQGATGAEEKSAAECVDHLQSIPAWFQMILFYYAAKEKFEKITEQHLEDLLINRAKLITRTQVSRAIATESIARFKEAGLTHYVWRTSEDERVVGNPKGLYPTGNPGHENHYIRDGKVFAFDNPPEDGHPGFAYNCRCVMLPVIKRKP
jgi:hypothetical protein